MVIDTAKLHYFYLLFAYIVHVLSSDMSPTTKIVIFTHVNQYIPAVIHMHGTVLFITFFWFGSFIFNESSW